MKFLYFSFLVIFSSYLYAGNSEFLLTPVSKGGVVELSRLADCLEVESVENIFGTKERLFLSENSLFSGEAVKVRVTNIEKFKRWVTRELSQIELKENFMVESTTVHDPLFKEQWGLHNRGERQEVDISDIHVVELLGKQGIDIGLFNTPEETEKDIVVAILDTGVDYRHPDLKAKIYHDPQECSALLKYEKCLQEQSAKICDKRWANHDGNGNGYPLDCAGWNILGNGNPLSSVKGSNDASDSIGHGTHIAGIIAAEKNGQGVEGVAGRVKILPVKVMGDVKAATSSQIPSNNERELGPVRTYADLFARGLLYAIRSNVDIINMSLGWSRSVDSALMRDLIKLALRRNIIIVAAAGNDSTAHPIYPCIYDGVICVGSFSADGTLSHFSNFGTDVDIAAPGQKILSSWPMKLTPKYFTERKGYEFKNGTSMSTPFVVGAMARLLNAGFSTQESYARLMLGAKKSERYRLEEGISKFTLSGNMHLATSFKVTPRSLLLPVKKGSHFLVWDGKSTTLPVSFKLKNFWISAKDVKIELSVRDRKGDFSFSKKEFNFSKIDTTQEITLKTNVLLKDLKVRSEFIVDAKIVDRYGDWHTSFSVEIILPLTDRRHHPKEVAISFPEHFVLNDSATVKSFTRLNQSDTLSYLLTEKQGRFYQLSLLKADRLSKSSTISRPFQFRGRSENIIGQWELDIDGDGVLEYVIAERILKSVRNRHRKRSKKSSNQIRFYFFTDTFTPLKVRLLGQFSNIITFENNHATIGKDFQWMRSNGTLVPTWIGKGEDLSKLNQPLNPWDDEVKVMGTFLYYFGEESLQSINTDSHWKLINFIKKDRGAGQDVSSLLYAKGNGFRYEFFTVDFTDLNQLSVTGSDELVFSINGVNKYFMIGGADNYAVAGAPLKSSFMDMNKDGGLYLGVWSQNQGQKLLTLNVSSKIDPLHALAGVFEIDGATYSFALGKYEVRLFKDEQLLGQTTLKRFSFMPGMTFDSFLYPVFMQAESKKAALYFPGGLGVSLSSEIITSRKIAQKVELFRPALFRLLATDGCQELNHVKKSEKTDLIFICHKQLRIIPLDFR